MIKYSGHIRQVSEYVLRLLKKMPAKLSFHNYKHTKGVVKAAEKLSSIENLPPNEKEMLIIAAWFHDTGFMKKYQGHEAVSQQIAERFLRHIGYPAKKIQVILDLISATKMPPAPKGQLQELICDANLWHLSSYNYDQWLASLKKELEAKNNESLSNIDWYKKNLAFIKNHRYSSSYGRSILEKRKKVNIRRIEKRLQCWKELVKKGKVQP